jgi:hypothetical protein
MGKTAKDEADWAVTVNSRPTADGYAIEAKIPLDKTRFPELDLRDGRVIGFDLAVNDADHQGERKSQLVWRGTKQNYCDASRFGKLVIRETVEKK